MPKWKITQEEYLRRLHMDSEEFVASLHLPKVKRVRTIVPLRDMQNIESLIPISAEMLNYILRSIRTMSGHKAFPRGHVHMLNLDPRQLRVGQKFVYRETYQKIMEDVPNIFKAFLVSNGDGLGNLGPYFAFGTTAQNEYAMACYIPPVVEKHGLDMVIMDGIHRNFIARQAGTTINAIVIDKVQMPFPCGFREWSDIKVIPASEKPAELNKRYFDLNAELFRDLKYLGIDG